MSQSDNCNTDLLSSTVILKLGLHHSPCCEALCWLKVEITLAKSLIARRLASGLNLNAYFSLSAAQSASPTAGKGCKEQSTLWR